MRYLKIIISVILFFVVLSSSFATNTYPMKAKITVEFQQATVKEILAYIEAHSKFKFFYSNAINIERVTSISKKNSNIFEILDALFRNDEIGYKVLDRQIVLVKKDENFTFSGTSDPLQQTKVTGTVTDPNGHPLPGVNILEKGTINGTITDLQGKFTITVASQQATLTFSYMGYISIEVPVNSNTIIDITLTEDLIDLSEIIVIGYGTIKKVDLTGSVSSVKGDELKTTNAANVATAIAGKLPGLQVTQTSGAPGSSSVVRMRGIGSVYSGTDPLVLIDGFPGDLSQVSPNDVESISVLKDAASASIYGSRAANGVILVTTKRGSKNQELIVELTAKFGVQKPTHIPEILDSKTWCEKMNEATLARDGVEYWTGENAPENQTTNTNWLDYIFRNDAPIQEYSMSALGGAEKLRYALNLGYLSQEGIMINQNYNKYNVRSNIDYISERLNLSVNMYHLHSDNESNIAATDNVLRNAFRTPPTIPVYNPDGLPGTPREGVMGEDVLLDNTPSMDAISREYEIETDFSVANLSAEIKIIDGLRFKTIFNYKATNTYAEDFEPEWYTYRPDDTTYETVFMGNATSELTATAYATKTWESQNLLTYKKEIGKHRFNLLAGYSAQKTHTSTLSAIGTGLIRNEVQSLDVASEKTDLSGYSSEGALISQFGRINYAYDEKYLAQVNLRRDGSSVFGDGHRWGTFPSASVGWRISKEKFMQGFQFLNDMKIRAGVGSLGNSNIPSGQWYSAVSFSSDYVFGTVQALNNGAALGTYNPNITWEKTTTYNVGIDLSMFDKKFDVSLEIFKRKTTNMLLIMPLPQTTGYSDPPYVNLGGVDNTGWEITAQHRNKFGDLSYNIGMNLTHVENEVTDMAGLSPIIEEYTRTDKGHAVNSYYGYVVEGIYQTEAEISESPAFDEAEPGDFRYKDLNSDGEINSEDQKYLGDAIPQFYFGGNINMGYKNFDVSLFFQGEFKKKIMVTPEFGMDFGTKYDYANMYKEVYDNRWTQEGDNKYPALEAGKTP